MGDKKQRRSNAQLSLYEESNLLAHLAERQSSFVSQLLDQFARADTVTEENSRLSRDLAGAVDRIQEVHHRIRNHLQTVTGLLSAQGLSETSPTARRALQLSAGRLASIAAIHDLLARDPSSGALRLPELVQQLAHHLLRQANAEKRLRIIADVSPLSLETRQATAFVLILTELISNSIEHAFDEEARGDIFLEVAALKDNLASLVVRDTGAGLPPNFTFDNCDSLGLGLVYRLAERDLGGKIEATNREGACFTVTFPIKLEENRL